MTYMSDFKTVTKKLASICSYAYYSGELPCLVDVPDDVILSGNPLPDFCRKVSSLYQKQLNLNVQVFPITVNNVHSLCIVALDSWNKLIAETETDPDLLALYDSLLED